MKHITRDTINALMSGNRKHNLRKCGYSEDDIKDGDSLYNALDDFNLSDLYSCKFCGAVFVDYNHMLNCESVCIMRNPKESVLDIYNSTGMVTIPNFKAIPKGGTFELLTKSIEHYLNQFIKTTPEGKE